MILQFFTIIFAYTFSLQRNQENANNTKPSETYHSSRKQPKIETRKKSFLELIFRFLISISTSILAFYGIIKFTIYYYQDADDIGTFLFVSLSYLFILAIPLLISLFFLNGSKENIEEIIQKCKKLT
ncbi:hypothetical protein EAG11_04925 [Flavobacterium sp. 140616W15]|nr:hypothetical protein EAG11_04925 [Flavobacterium sp. 140616W15]